jgi:hypothetical protein
MRRVVKDKVIDNISKLQPTFSDANIETFRLQTNVSDKQYKQFIKEAYRLNKLVYFKMANFNPKDLISDAFILMSDKKLKYDPEVFYRLMWQVMNKRNYVRIKKIPNLYKQYLNRIKEHKARGRKNVTDYYIRTLLRQTYSTEYINEHPEMIEERRNKILNWRKLVELCKSGELYISTKNSTSNLKVTFFDK